MIKTFFLVCKKCNLLKKPHRTNIHFDYDNGYTLMCLTCGNQEKVEIDTPLPPTEEQAEKITKEKSVRELN